MLRKSILQLVVCVGVSLTLGFNSASSEGQSPTADSENLPPTANATGINKLNHIIFMAQENRSFDHYFGEMRQYWADNGYADRSFDGLPQFNPSSGLPPYYGPPPTNPGCDPADPPPKDCTIDGSSPKVQSFELITQCTENTSPSWNEAHVDWDYYDPMGKSAATLNGFVYTAAHDARADHFYDYDGIRAMGYYDSGDLNYYYFMASNFATSDRWFNPAMARTHPNREYLVSGTSQGDAYPIGHRQRRQEFAYRHNHLSRTDKCGRKLEDLREPYEYRLQRATLQPSLLAANQLHQIFHLGTNHSHEISEKYWNHRRDKL